MTLSNLKGGDQAIVTHVDAGAPEVAAKYAARGIVPGTTIGVLRAGDPLLVGIDNERWAINRLEAALIHVDVLASRRRWWPFPRRK